MIAFSGQRSVRAQAILDIISKREWGLIILDEVHVAPAKTFRKCVSVTHSRCKLGLTATLVREDDLIDDEILEIFVEEAEEEISVDYNGGELEIGFNVSYLLDVLNAMDGDSVEVKLGDSNSSALICDPNDRAVTYVVMPMRL